MAAALAIFRAVPTVLACCPSGFDTKAWLLREQFAIPASPTPQGELSLIDLVPGRLVGAVRTDAIRTALSAVETLADARRAARDDQALAWSIVMTYYSAFFSAHAIARIIGNFTIWADPAHVAAVRSVGVAHLGSQTGLPRGGQWNLIVDIASGSALVRPGNGTRGGAHEAFWSAFSRLIDFVTPSIAASNSLVPDQARTAIMQLTGVKSFVDSGALVGCRHEVNYRRGLGVWYPYDGIDVSASSYASRVRGRLEPNDIARLSDLKPSDGLMGVLSFCRGLNALLIELLRMGAMLEHADDIKSGPLRLVGQFRV